MIRSSAACAVALATVVALAGCGGGGKPSAQKALSQTASRLGKITSGRLHLALALDPRVRGGEAIGFRLDGPFSLAGDKLPVASIAYVQRRGTHTAQVRLISDGSHGFVAVGGKAYELSSKQAAQLRLATAGLRGSGGLGALPIDGWIDEPQLSDGGSVDGVATDRITGRLNVVNAVNGLVGLTQGLGGGAGNAIRGADAKELEQAVRSSRFAIWTGRKDHLLRRLTMDVDFALAVPAKLRRSLGDLVGARFRFSLGVDDPNGKVAVTAPANALPASQLPHS